MADGTTLNIGSGGDTILTEHPGSSGPKIPVSKIYTGALDANGGPVTVTNPLPVELSDATNVIGTAAHPVRTDPTGTTTQPVSAAALPLPSGASTAASQSTGNTTLASILAALQATLTIAGTVTANVANATLAAGTALIGAVASALRTDSIMNGTTSLTPKFAKVTLAATGEFVPLVGGKKIRILRYSLMADAACTVWFKSHTAGQISGSKYLSANGGAGGTFSPIGHFETVSGEALDLNITGTANVSGDISYVEV